MIPDIPEELILEILSRIPIKSVCACKCVCKSWLKLLQNPEFALSHLSKSAPALLVNHCSDERTVFKIFDIHQESSRLIELDIFNNLHQDRWTRIECSINGLIFFRISRPEQYYICNPVTRERVKLPNPEGIEAHPSTVAYGFGISSKGGQYKVVRFFEGCPKFICQVYTLSGGTRSWRSIAITPSPHEEELLKRSVYSKGTFLKGNLHWLGIDLEGCWWVSCLDLETEALSKFRAPALESGRWFSSDIGVLRDCLCLCVDDSESEFVIYTMSCYAKKSWVKECVIRKSSDLFGGYYGDAYPVKVFGDNNGGVVMALHDLDCHFFFYSNNDNKRTNLLGINFNHDGDDCFFKALLYTPSFVLLGDFDTSVIRY